MKRVLIILAAIVLLFCCFYGCKKESAQTNDSKNMEVFNSDTYIEATGGSAYSNKADNAEKSSENISKTFGAANSETVKEAEATDADASSSQTTKEILIVSDVVFNYNTKKDGVVLEVSAPEKTSKNREFYVIAKVTNCSEGAIEYWVPFTEGLHKEINVAIEGEDGKEFTDRDAFGVTYDAGLKKMMLEPNESYTEMICFIPGWVKADYFNPGVENWEITYFNEGTYNGTAVFNWDTEDGVGSVSLEFPIIVV